MKEINIYYVSSVPGTVLDARDKIIPKGKVPGPREHRM